MSLTVLAMGGNSLVDPARPPTVANQIDVTERAVRPIASLIAQGVRLVITHGNGPQVGFLALRSELTRDHLHEVPLDALVADTQGSLGYMIQRALREELRHAGLEREVVSVVTEVEVDPHDHAFDEPTKPIGRFYTAEEARIVAAERGWVVHEDAHRGWRRVVPSPAPVRIVQLSTIRRLVDSGVIVVCCGGGGVPVVRGDDGDLHGIEGVIDKDRASALLAVRLGADRLVMSTAVDRIYRDFLTEHPTPIDRITPTALRALADAGQFPQGSMGPKVKAALTFLKHGGRTVIVCRPEDLVEALAGTAGTTHRGGDMTDPLAALFGRSLLLTQDATPAELEALLDLAARFEARDRAGKRSALLPHELAYAMFFDNSTRTKSAWAGAAARLGMHPVIVDGSSTQVAHGETARETGAMLGMNAHALGVRHDLILGEGNAFMREVQAGIEEYLAATGQDRKVPIVNLQCDIDHPTQTLADLATLREHFPDGVAGKRIAVSWAYSPSYAKPLSVPQGLIMLLTRFGAEITLAHPKGYRLMDGCLETAAANADASGGSFTVTHDMDAAFQGAHVVYPKSWGPYDLMLERVDANRARDAAALRAIEARALDRNSLHRDWICDADRMARTARGEALYMHCLPADIGAEVTADVLEAFRVPLARQAQKKLYVIMALLAASKVPDLDARLRALE